MASKVDVRTMNSQQQKTNRYVQQIPIKWRLVELVKKSFVIPELKIMASC